MTDHTAFVTNNHTKYTVYNSAVIGQVPTAFSQHMEDLFDVLIESGGKKQDVS